jgi:hypothetical protein
LAFWPRIIAQRLEGIRFGAYPTNHRYSFQRSICPKKCFQQAAPVNITQRDVSAQGLFDTLSTAD